MKHLYTMAEADTIAADSWRQAMDAWLEYTSEDEADYQDSLEQIPDDMPHTIKWEPDDLPDFEEEIPASAERSPGDGDNSHLIYITAKAGEWAKLQTEAGIFSSTEW